MATAVERPTGCRPRLIGGQYERIRSLSEKGARGACSTRVILARGLEGRLVVLKEMHPALTEDMIRQEAALHDRLSHRNIARYYGLLMHEQRTIVDDAPPEITTCWYLVTEYLSGGSLAQKLQHGPMRLIDVHRLLLCIARGLACIHNMDIQHRDLKPENVCLEHEGEDAEPKILDFGGSKERALSRITAIGVGTPMYMSPERLKREKWGRGDDIWALGIMYAEMLQGERIDAIFGDEKLPGDRTEEEIAWLVDDKCGGDDLLRRMLSRNPEDRPTAADIVAELDDGRPGPAPTSPITPSTPLPRPSSGCRFDTAFMANDRANLADRVDEAVGGGGLGWTRLHTAMARGEEDLVRAALEAGIQDSTTRGGVHASCLRPALWCRVTGRPAAAVAGVPDPPGNVGQAVTELLAMVANGRTSAAALCCFACAAVETLGVAAVRKAVMVGRKFGDVWKRKWTALAAAAAAGICSLCSVCIELGAEVNKMDDDGETPLFIACQEGHIDCARLLLNRGAVVDKACDFGSTPLREASQRGHVDCARLLLDRGAGVDKADDEGRTPLNRACWNGHAVCAHLLLSRGAVVDRIDIRGRTALQMACVTGHVDCARLFLDHGAQVDQADNGGTTPLHWACQHGKLGCARLLLDRGAEVDNTSNSGWTSLHNACYWNRRFVAALLLEHGADPTRLSGNGETPADRARSGDSFTRPDNELAEVLRQARRDRAAAVERLWKMDPQG